MAKQINIPEEELRSELAKAQLKRGKAANWQSYAYIFHLLRYQSGRSLGARIESIVRQYGLPGSYVYETQKMLRFMEEYPSLRGTNIVWRRDFYNAVRALIFPEGIDPFADKWPDFGPSWLLILDRSVSWLSAQADRDSIKEDVLSLIKEGQMEKAVRTIHQLRKQRKRGAAGPDAWTVKEKVEPGIKELFDLYGVTYDERARQMVTDFAERVARLIDQQESLNWG